MTENRRYNRCRQLIAMLLLAVLLPMLAVKSFHFHSEGTDACHQQHSEMTHFAQTSVQADCELCQFVIPPFQTAGEVMVTPYRKITTVERNIPRVATVVVSIIRAQANAPPLA